MWGENGVVFCARTQIKDNTQFRGVQVFLYSVIKHYVEEGNGMKRKLMDILACPIDKYYPLELRVFEEKEEIVEGVIICPKCLRWYPIRDEIPEMLPDELREEKNELRFLQKWKNKIPQKILLEGNPFHLKGET